MNCPLCRLAIVRPLEDAVFLVGEAPKHRVCPEPAGLPNFFQSDRPACRSCGGIMDRSGRGWRCGNCGETSGEVDPLPPAPAGLSEDSLCEDCDGPLSEHTGGGLASPWTACRGFMPRGPKQ